MLFHNKCEQNAVQIISVYLAQNLAFQNVYVFLAVHVLLYFLSIAFNSNPFIAICQKWSGLMKKTHFVRFHAFPDLLQLMPNPMSQRPITKTKTNTTISNWMFKQIYMFYRVDLFLQRKYILRVR